MIAINRELSNISEEYVYTILDSVDVDVKQNNYDVGKSENNNYYLVKYLNNNQYYIFRGTKGEKISSYIGFETSDNELNNYQNNLRAIYQSHLDFNFDLRVDDVYTRLQS